MYLVKSAKQKRMLQKCIKNSLFAVIQPLKSLSGQRRTLCEIFFLNIIRKITILPAGLYDMMGNTWEWTSTPFPAAQPMYVLRGASWIDTVDGSANHKARITTRWVISKRESERREKSATLLHSWLTAGSDCVSRRMGNTPDSASDNLGFRCAATDGQKQRKKKDKSEL